MLTLLFLIFVIIFYVTIVAVPIGVALGFVQLCLKRLKERSLEGIAAGLFLFFFFSVIPFTIFLLLFLKSQILP